MRRPGHKITPTSREHIKRLIDQAPNGWYVDLREETRTLEQNDRMWSMLDDIRDARIPYRDWQGVTIYPTSDDWKQIFLASLKMQRIVPGLDGKLVALENKTSKLTKAEMSALMALIEAYAAQHDVTLRVWNDEKEQL